MPAGRGRARPRKAVRPGPTLFYWLTLSSAAIVVVLLLGGVMVSLLIGSWPALSTFGFSFVWTADAGTRSRRIFGALAPIYGTIITSIIAMLIGIPVSFGIAIFLTELCPRAAAPPDRHRHRAARRHPLDHLRPLGLLLSRAVPADDGAALPDRHDRQGARLIGMPVRRRALRHRPADRRHHPRHHGAALHHLDHPRRVRHGAGAAARKRLRHGHDDLGSGAARSSFPIPASASSAASCSASAARSARPWR